MRWNREAEGGWKWHFALIPRQLVDGSWAWLEWVQKRTCYDHVMVCSYSFIEYRAAPQPAFKSCRSIVAADPTSPPPPKPKR